MAQWVKDLVLSLLWLWLQLWQGFDPRPVMVVSTCCWYGPQNASFKKYRCQCCFYQVGGIDCFLKFGGEIIFPQLLTP